MYKIIGADGREYGPVTAGQLQQWITEGRANAQTQALAPGAPEWKPLGVLPEFASRFAPPVPPLIGSLKPEAFGARPARRTSSLAMAGLVFGILGLPTFCCCCGMPFNILGLVFSLAGLVQVKRHPEIYEGRGLATAGLVLSAAGLVLAFGIILINLALHPGNFKWHYKTF